MTKAEQQEQEEARQELRKLLTPGQTVYANLRHVSRSGMQRVISLHIIQPNEYQDGTPFLRDISGLAARAIGSRLDRDRYGIVVGGCGFHLVYNLGHAVWPNGTPEPHSTRNGEPDYSGGYALRKEWI